MAPVTMHPTFSICSFKNIRRFIWNVFERRQRKKQKSVRSNWIARFCLLYDIIFSCIVCHDFFQCFSQVPNTGTDMLIIHGGIVQTECGTRFVHVDHKRRTGNKNDILFHRHFCNLLCIIIAAHIAPDKQTAARRGMADGRREIFLDCIQHDTAPA